MKSKFYISITLFFLFFLTYTNAQVPDWPWAKAMGGISIYGHGTDRAHSVVVDAAGNVYTSGFFSGTVDFDPGPGIYNLIGYSGFVSKLDSSGNFVWAKAIGNGDALTLDVLGNVYVTGSFTGSPIDFDPDSFGTFFLTAVGTDIFVLKLDNFGDFVWVKQITADYSVCHADVYSIVTDPLGNVYITGNYTLPFDFDPGPGVFKLTGFGCYVLKLDSSGNFDWVKGFDGNTYSAACDNSGNVYITGFFMDTVDFDPGIGIFNLISQDGKDIFNLKLDSSGNFIWANQFAGTGDYDRSRSITLDASSNVYTTGYFDGTVDFDPGPGTFYLTNNGIYISKLNSAGNFIWAIKIGGGGGKSITLDALGNIYSTGQFSGTRDFDPGTGEFNLVSTGVSDIYISKLDNSGNFVWAKSIGGPDNDYVSSIAIDINENVIIAGNFRSPSIKFGSIVLTNSLPGDDEIFIAKLNKNDFPCSAITCTINPSVKIKRVSNNSCNNGMITVNLGGTFQAFPHIELYDSLNTIISSVYLSPGNADFIYANLHPGHYTVKVFDNSCCEVDMAADIKCAPPSSGFGATYITSTSARLIWHKVECANGYRLQYREQGTVTWTNVYAKTNVGRKTINGLQPLTTYEWHVATRCSGAESFPYYSHSANQTFTTAALRIGEEQSISSTESFDLSLYPNPATYTVTVNFEADASTATMSVMNTVGQVMFEKQLNGADGIYEEQLDVSKLNTGIYMLQVKTENGFSWKKFVRE